MSLDMAWHAQKSFPVKTSSCASDAPLLHIEPLIQRAVEAIEAPVL